MAGKKNVGRKSTSKRGGTAKPTGGGKPKPNKLQRRGVDTNNLGREDGGTRRIIT